MSERAATAPHAPGPAPIPHDQILDPDVLLRDGEVVHVREVQTSDEDGVRALLDHLSVESSRGRFFNGAVNLRAAADWATELNPDRVGLVAMSSAGQVVGHGVVPGRRPRIVDCVAGCCARDLTPVVIRTPDSGNLLRSRHASGWRILLMSVVATDFSRQLTQLRAHLRTASAAEAPPDPTNWSR